METTGKRRSPLPLKKAEEESSDRIDFQVDRAKQGDLGAFSEIYDQYVGRIYNYIYRMVGSREDAEDITQDTFRLVYTNLKYLRDHSHFIQWLYKIARNEVYKNRRKTRVKPESLEDSSTGILQVLKSEDLEGNPENKLLSVELGKKFKAVLDSLPMNYKETLILATLQELSYHEISQILGRSLSSVKTDVYRARIIISEKMRKYLTSR